MSVSCVPGSDLAFGLGHLLDDPVVTENGADHGLRGKYTDPAALKGCATVDPRRDLEQL
jgi:hypothetical protein